MKIRNKSHREQLNQVDISIYTEDNFKNSLAMEYHENSKHSEYESRVQGIKISSFDNKFYHLRASQPYKVYPGAKRIDLTPYLSSENVKTDFFEIIKKRRSIRNFESYSISLKEICHLMYYSYGISQVNPIKGLNNGSWSYRNVPSGGALYPLELYVVIFKGDIENGLYHFRSDINALELLKAGDFYESIRKIVSAEPYIELKEASCVIFITSIFERFLIKYGDRGYRLMMQEVGFVGMNISLVSEVLNLGSCMAGGYLDNKVNKFIGIDNMSESIQNVIVIGKPKPTSDDKDQQR